MHTAHFQSLNIQYIVYTFTLVLIYCDVSFIIPFLVNEKFPGEELLQKFKVLFRFCSFTKAVLCTLIQSSFCVTVFALSYIMNNIAGCILGSRGGPEHD